jgi:hypothetical protein
VHSSLAKTTNPYENDFLADLFVVKKHQAYSRREKNDRRTAFIGEKFKDVWAVGNAEMDKKIKEEYEKRTKETADFQKEREDKRKELMRKTKEYQHKQVRDK